jgi:hypothetical protein
MRQISIILILVLIISSSCRKFKWDNPYDTANPNQSSEPASLKDGLVAYYPFNGNANDESGNGNNGLVNGAIFSPNRYSKQNSSYLFNGLDNYIRIKSINMEASQEMIISVWIKPINITQNKYYTIIRQEDPIPKLGLDWLLAFQEYGKFLSFGLRTNNGYSELDVPISPLKFLDGNWHNLIAVYDGSKRFIYVDNILLGSDPKSGSIIFDNSTATIGTSQAGNTLGEFFYGNIDELRFYNRALTQEEITYLANN